MTPLEWAFRQPHYLALNEARLTHLGWLLDKLCVDPKGKRVIDLGAGIGDLAKWWVERDANVWCIEGRAECVDYLKSRGFLAWRYDLSNPPPLHNADIAFCYGLLYHLQDWRPCVRAMLENTPLVIIETMIGDGMLADEDAGDPSQSLTGVGSRPRREELIESIRRNGFSIEECGQPDHADYRDGRRLVIAARKTA